MLTANAAEVLWGLFSTYKRLDTEASPGVQVYYFGNIQPEIGIQYEYTDGVLSSINGQGIVNVGINMTIWVDAVYGDVLCDEYFMHNERVYSYNDYFGPDWSGAEIRYEREVTQDEQLYIAFAGERELYPFYGWLELLVKDDELSLVSSALTYSPRLIVGTGDFAAIPEPSAGMLLLLGLAALVLRRRRESYAEQFSVEPRFGFAKHGGETCAGPYLAKMSGNPLKTATPQGVSPQRAWSSTQRHGGTKAQSVF